MGAGILECDVTFTKDAELVCRHAQCDLHTTTNILATDLASTCRVPFTPAEFDAHGTRVKDATARCCTTDLTLAEFKRLKGKMDASNPNALTVEEFLGGTPRFRTDLYATGGTLLSHKESIELIGSLGAKFTPELKGIDRDSQGNRIVADNHGFGDSGLDQQSYARKMIQEYIDAGIDPAKVFPQSFNLNDMIQWIHEFPTFGLQAVYLISDISADKLAGPPSVINEHPPTLEAFVEVRNLGVNIIAPPMPVLVKASANSTQITPSQYAERARQAGFDLISWTTERSGRIVEDVLVVGGNTFYYQTTLDALTNDGDILGSVAKLDVGARSSNRVAGIQWLTDANTLEKATLRQSLTVRSFSGRFARIGRKPRVDVHRAVQERENTLVYARTRREMTAPTAAFPDDGQRQGSVAKLDVGAKSKNRVSGIQWLTDANTLEKATLRQNHSRRGVMP